MADVSYDVEVRYFSSGNPNQALDKAKKGSSDWLKDLSGGLSSALGSINGTFDSLASSLLSGLVGAATAGTAALTAGIVKATQVGVEFNSEIEQATIGMGTIFAANGSSQGIIGGMIKSREIMAEMRKDARELPGEFKDLVNIMATIATPGGHAGKTPEEIEKLAAQTMASAAVLHVPQATAAREMAMLLEGNAKHSQPLALRLGLGDLKAFNQMAPEKRFDKIKEALDKLNPSIEYFAHSWEGIKSTGLDALRGGLGKVTAPLMDIVKSRLFDFLNPRTEKQLHGRQRLADFGDKVGKDLVIAFFAVEGFINRWKEPAETFIKTLSSGFHNTFGRLEPMFDRIGEKIKAFMEDPKAFDKIADTAKLLIAARVGSGALQGGFSAVSGIAGMMGGGGGAAGGAAGLAGLIAAGPEIAIAAAAVAALGVAAYGAVEALENSKGPLHEEAVKSAVGIGVASAEMASSWSKLAKAAEPVTELFGVALLNIIEGFVSLGAIILEFAADVATAGRRIVEQLYGYATGDYSGKVKPDPHGPYRDNPERVFRNPYEDENKYKTPPPPNNHTTIHKVEINVEGNEDPDRVAQVVFEKIKDLGNNPKTSPQDPRTPMLNGRTL